MAWKIRHGILLVDSFIQSKGFQLASRCRCCIAPRIESEDHLLAQGDLAKHIWSWISDMAGLHRPVFNFKSLWRSWACSPSYSPRRSAVHLLLLSAGIWEIWKFRCAATYGDPLPWPREKLFKSNLAILIRKRIESHAPKLALPPLLLDSCNFCWEDDPPAILSERRYVGWKPGEEAATANVACLECTVACIFRSRDGFPLGGASFRFNPQALMGDLPLILDKINDMALLLNIPTASLQWDRDVVSFAARKWTLASGLPDRIPASALIPRQANAAARALAQDCSSLSDSFPALYPPDSLPPRVRAAVLKDRQGLLA